MSKTNLLSIISAVGLIVGLSNPAFAQEASSPKEMDALFACQSQTEDAARLGCFDETVRTLRAANASGDLVALSRDEVENVERDAFGFNLPSLPRLRGLFGSGDPDGKPNDLTRPIGNETAETPKDEKILKRVTLSVDRLETFNRGRYRFYLTNGQVWSQNDSDKLRRPRKGDNGILEVEIRKAAFGTFLLQVNGSGRSVRVRRTE